MRCGLPRVRALVALAATFATPAALAQREFIAAPLQFSAMAGIAVPENLRGLEPGPSLRLLLGVPLRPGAFLEASVFGLEAAAETGGKGEQTFGGGIDLRLERLGAQRLSYSFLFGGGLSQARYRSADVAAPFVNIGYGIGYELSERLSLRNEVRGMARFDTAFIPGRGVSYDLLLTAGFSYSLGRAPAAAAPPSPPPLSQASPPPLPSEPAAKPAPAVAASAPPAESALPARVVLPVVSAAGRCPVMPTAVTVSVAVDSSGCLLPQKLALPRALFFDDLAAKTLRTEGDAALSALAAALLRQPGLRASITVHTDSLGFADDNLAATAALAAQIGRRLFELGVDAGCYDVTGVGESEPAASEDSEPGIERNRRVVIDLVPP